MTYRDDADAYPSKRAAFVEAITAQENLVRRERMLDELAVLDRGRRIAVRRKLPVLAGARIASPCHEPFEAMLGSGAIRHCGRCDREVFDVARMTLAEAEALVTERSCARFTKRSDGTMMFADCEVGASGIRARRIGALVAGVAIVSAAVAIAVLPHPPLPLPRIAPRHPPASAAPGVRFEMGQMRSLPQSAGVPFS